MGDDTPKASEALRRPSRGLSGDMREPLLSWRARTARATKEPRWPGEASRGWCEGQGLGLPIGHGPSVVDPPGGLYVVEDMLRDVPGPNTGNPAVVADGQHKQGIITDMAEAGIGIILPEGLTAFVALLNCHRFTPGKGDSGQAPWSLSATT
jgi:hypothetical protein